LRSAARCLLARGYAANEANENGSMIDGSSFSDLLTRVEIGDIRIGSAGCGRSKPCGSVATPSQRM
jgi:hypothetical protein